MTTMSMRTINIPIDLFGLLVRYHILGIQSPEDGDAIRRGLQAKLDAMERRDAYTQSKIAATPEEREAARIKYLDLAGIHEDWRTP